MENKSGFPVSPLCDRSGNISKVLRNFNWFSKDLLKFDLKESRRFPKMYCSSLIWKLSGIYEKVNLKKRIFYEISFANRPEIKEACVDQIYKNLLYWEEQKKQEEVKKKHLF